MWHAGCTRGSGRGRSLPSICCRATNNDVISSRRLSWQLWELRKKAGSIHHERLLTFMALCCRHSLHSLIHCTATTGPSTLGAFTWCLFRRRGRQYCRDWSFCLWTNDSWWYWTSCHIMTSSVQIWLLFNQWHRCDAQAVVSVHKDFVSLCTHSFRLRVRLFVHYLHESSLTGMVDVEKRNFFVSTG